MKINGFAADFLSNLLNYIQEPMNTSLEQARPSGLTSKLTCHFSLTLVNCYV